LKNRYNLSEDILILTGTARGMTSDSNIADALIQAEKYYIAKIEAEKEKIPDYSGLREVLLARTKFVFDIASQMRNTSQQNSLLEDVRKRFLKITAKEEYIRHASGKREIIPAMEELQTEAAKHVQLNRITKGVRTKMQERFERVYGKISSEIEGEDSERVLYTLREGKRKISEETTGLKRVLADFAYPFSRAKGYSLRYREIEFEDDKPAARSTERVKPVQQQTPKPVHQAVKSKPEAAYVPKPLPRFLTYSPQTSAVPKVPLRTSEPEPDVLNSFYEFQAREQEKKRAAREVEDAGLSMNRLNFQRRFGFISSSQAEKERLRIFAAYGSKAYQEAGTKLNVAA
jgi:hypothetical protein